MSATFLVSAEGVRVLDDQGWREPIPGECIETEDGNYIQINAENYWTGLLHGIAAGVLASLFGLGIVAIAASGLTGAM